MIRRIRFPTLLALAVALIALGLASSGGSASAGGPSDPPGLERAIAAQEAHTDQLFAIQGVAGTAVGLNPGGTPVVKIYTESPGVAGLPASLDGVPVLIEVTGRIFASAPPPTVASFTYACTGLTCDFDASATTGQGPRSYDWDFGDGTSHGSGVTVSHTYAAAGTYDVTLTATAKKSGTDSETQPITVSDGGGGGTNSPPTASFTYSCSGTACSFTDTSTDSDGIVVAWSWDFGDSNTSTAQHPSHTYAADGTYTVSLTITDDGGATDTDSQSVTASSTINPASRFNRPVPIGVSTGHPNITAGTIGSRVTNGTNVFALSNNHVYANSNNATIGDPALQPGPYDGGTSPADSIGALYDYEPIQFGGPNNYMDAAIALSSTANLGNATPSNGYGAPNSVPVSAALNMPVQKYGRTTSLTTGTVAEINVTVDVCYEGFIVCTKWARFVNQLGITPGSFSAGGDSGSLIVTNDANRNPVGLLFAGGDTRTIANRIDLVLNRFGVTIDGGAGSNAPVVSITSPAHGSTFGSGASIAFAGTASDADDGDLTANLVWTSSINGQIGTGGSFSTTLSDGNHTITASVTDLNGAIGSNSVSITVGNPPATTVSVSSVSYSASGPNLYITVALVNDLGNPVSGASVEIILVNNNTGQIWIGTGGTTGADGTVTWRLRNAPSGCYATTVTSVIATGLTWDFITPANSFCK